MQSIMKKVIFGFVLVIAVICWGIPKVFAGGAGVLVDINPQSCPNSLNCDKRGVIPVAILGTETLDVNDIDCSTLLLMGVSPLRCVVEDVATPLASPPDFDCFDCNELGSDGFMDLVLKFDAQAVVAALISVTNGECVQLTLTGELLDGTPIQGMDTVLIRCN